MVRIEATEEKGYTKIAWCFHVFTCEHVLYTLLIQTRSINANALLVLYLGFQPLDLFQPCNQNALCCRCCTQCMGCR